MAPVIPFIPLIAAGVGAAGTVGAALIGKGKSSNSAPKPAKVASPVAGESTVLSPGDKINLINTSSQGILSPPNTGRQTILGN